MTDMLSGTRAACFVWFGVTSLLLASLALRAAPPPAAEKPASGEQPVSIEVARDRAKLAHNIYAATLNVIHRHYFRENKAILPARALEDVFAEIADQSQLTARWIAVNTKPMSIHHEPKTDFEKQAAAAIAAGQEAFERIENGEYLRAGVIPLTGECINCHTGTALFPPKSPRYAALVIRVPVKSKE